MGPGDRPRRRDMNTADKADKLCDQLGPPGGSAGQLGRRCRRDSLTAVEVDGQPESRLLNPQNEGDDIDLAGYSIHKMRETILN